MLVDRRRRWRKSRGAAGVRVPCTWGRVFDCTLPIRKRRRAERRDQSRTRSQCRWETPPHPRHAAAWAAVRWAQRDREKHHGDAAAGAGPSALWSRVHSPYDRRNTAGECMLGTALKAPTPRSATRHVARRSVAPREHSGGCHVTGAPPDVGRPATASRASQLPGYRPPNARRIAGGTVCNGSSWMKSQP